MTLSEFINTKPPELRLGQYFFNAFIKTQPDDALHKELLWFYNSSDDEKVIGRIKQLMLDYQWDSLPF